MFIYINVCIDVYTHTQVHHADLDFSGAAGLLGFEDEMRSKNVTVWETSK